MLSYSGATKGDSHYKLPIWKNWMLLMVMLREVLRPNLNQIEIS